jgi:uncharacterized membrane protein
MDKKEKGNKVALGILSYLGILIIISYLVDKNDPFVKFHIKQGLVLLVVEIIVWVLGPMFWMLWMVWRLVDLAILIYVIIGIANVVEGKESKLPFIGGFSRYFKF